MDKPHFNLEAALRCNRGSDIFDVYFYCAAGDRKPGKPNSLSILTNMLAMARSIIFTLLLCFSFVVAHEAPGSADRALAVRNVLAKYAIEIDNQNLSALGDIFTEDVVANYTGQDGKVLLNGVPAIQDFLRTRYVQLDSDWDAAD